MKKACKTGLSERSDDDRLYTEEVIYHKAHKPGTDRECNRAKMEYKVDC